MLSVAEIYRPSEFVNLWDFADMLRYSEDSMLPIPSSIRSPFHFLILNHFYPIIVRVKHECHLLHSAICKSLLPVDPRVFQAFACCIEIVDGNACEMLVLAILHGNISPYICGRSPEA